MSNYTFVRYYKPEGTQYIRIVRKSELPDLSEHACLGVRKDGMEEWVPKEHYERWQKIFDKANNHEDKR